jgi:hypothetical protein
VRGAAGTGDDEFQAALFGRLGVADHELRRAVRTDDALLERHAQRGEFAAACAIVSQSEELPMMIPTRGDEAISFKR